MSNEIATQEEVGRDMAAMPGFGSQDSWELANRIAKAFAASTIVPKAYQNNVANCIVALEMANRMRISPIMVMQNLYIVRGNPGWSAKFLIASFNECGRFSALRYEWNTDHSECRAWAVAKEDGERIKGPAVTLAMAEAEGWSTKEDSKWKTMPDLMLMYRSAAFLIRTYTPEISLGFQTKEELDDVIDATPVNRKLGLDAVRAALDVPIAPSLPGADSDEVTHFIDRIDGCSTAPEAATVLSEALSTPMTDEARELIKKNHKMAWGQ